MKDKMYTLDCGKNTATLYNGEIVKTISHKEVLCLAGHLEAGSTLVGEYAHFGCPRKELSRAQPFTEDQLLKWYNDLRANNITLKLFPQQSTVRACISAFGVKKVKENGKLVKKVTKGDNTDPEAIYKIIKKHSNISLMNPPKSFGFDKVGCLRDTWMKMIKIQNGLWKTQGIFIIIYLRQQEKYLNLQNIKLPLQLKLASLKRETLRLVI